MFGLCFLNQTEVLLRDFWPLFFKYKKEVVLRDFGLRFFLNQKGIVLRNFRSVFFLSNLTLLGPLLHGLKPLQMLIRIHEFEAIFGKV
jgi:hypothetical protein